MRSRRRLEPERSRAILGGARLPRSQASAYQPDPSGEARKNGIYIAVPNVQLDLNGFSVTGAAGKGSLMGVYAASTAAAGRVFNGSVTGWGSTAVFLFNDSSVDHITASPNFSAGMNVLGDSTVRGNRSVQNDGNGIHTSGGGSRIEGNQARDNVGIGFLATNGDILLRKRRAVMAMARPRPSLRHRAEVTSPRSRR